MLDTEINGFISKVHKSGHKINQTSVWSKLPARLNTRCDKLADNLGIPKVAALYMIANGLKKRPTCRSCGQDTRIVGKWNICMFKEHCSCKCAGLDKRTDERRRKTVKATYGVEYVQSDPKVRKKFLKTMNQNHGVSYGGQSAEVHKKMTATLIKRYGVQGPMAYKPFHEKARQTWLANYGVDHPAKDRETMEAMHKGLTKEFTLNKKTFRIRGYEQKVIEHFVSKGVSVKNILTTAKEGLPCIPYVESGKQRQYHPDMLIKHQGQEYLIEVKSTYTAGIQKKQPRFKWYNTRLKMKAATKAGYKTKLAIATEKRGVVIIHDPQEKTRADVRKIVRTTLNPRQV